jgi:uncharacterized RDD family membrane protein YckC
MTREPEEPFLFDLPLSGPPPSAAAARSEVPSRRGGRRAARPESLPLFGEEDFDPSEASPESDDSSHQGMPVAPARGPVPVPRPRGQEEPRPAPAAGPATAPMARRLRAACGDLAILVAVGGVGAVGATLLGAHLRLASLPALFVFLLSFSFLYSVVSLAFWGQTPGMAWCGLIARSEETEPLSFGQTALRWLGHWLTWVLLGLPSLLALSGRSLVDRLSGSCTYELPLSGSSAA